MVARSESMFGCYDSYSYRLWSLANVWSTYQFPSLANGAALKEDSGDASNNGGEYFIKCPQCQKGCASFQALKEHTETAHGGEDGAAAAAGASPPPAAITGGPLACSQCSATFATRDQLEKHELLHSPNAPVSCKICQKTFANVYRLQRHMISHDESALLRKFKCTQCDKAFKFKHHLKEHIRIHSGEKPFECANCGKRFSHSGSYSSHMTSKKCLVMNLKMGGRTRAPGSNSALDKSQTAKAKRPITSGPNLNNNITSSPNNNSFLPILPKYSEAAAAAFLSVMAPLDRNYQTPPSSATPLHPFYMPHLNGSAIAPYTMPSLGHLFEQLHSNSPHRPPSFSDSIKDEMKQLSENKSYSINDDQNASKCDDSTMDVDEKQQDNLDDRRSPGNGSNSGDLEAVKRILETVQATVNKQLLQASMQKLTSTPPPTSDSPPLEQKDSLKMCSDCNKTFDNHRDYDEHECCGNEQQVKVKSEGLAAKLEDAVTVKTEDASLNGVCSGTDEDEENTSVSRPHNEYDIDSESMTTGDHMSEDGRKVRVRSQIGDEQLAVLKEHYLMNPRPKREELVRIANQIGFPVRVVQVWFQNTRARDRREGRLVNVPYAPIHPASMMQFPNSVAPSSTTIPLPYHQPSSPHYLIAEQPLDLSTKKSHSSTVSSPASSPRRPVSATAHSESGEEAVNLSHKSSRSPTPYRQVPYQSMHYQSSNCSSDYHRSPSPGACENGSGNGSSRLARILAQPAHRLAAMGGPMGILPVERLLHYTTPELSMAKSPLMTPASSSPGSDRRSWKMEENDEYNISHEMDQSEDDHSAKRMKVAQMAIKNLGNATMPVSSTPESEAEGQFVCDQCDKAFSKQSSLARHKYEHSGQRPHKCDECPKAFKHKHHLTEHKRLHSGEKPFQCCKCLKRFSHSGSYSQHMNHRYSYCKPYRE